MKSIALLGLWPLVATAQNILTDSGQFGPPLEIAHLYNGQWPTGVTVSAQGRKFSNFPAGLDPKNVKTANNSVIAVGELLNDNTEVAYPSRRYNSPPGGAINYTTTPPTGANYKNFWIGVQSVVIDSSDRLWVLDTGRAIDANSGMLVNSSPGGPKLVSINLKSNQVTQTITFPVSVVYGDSYLNDVRFDLRTNTAYITDSSNEGRNGIIIVDLVSGNSWRHFDSSPAVRNEQQFLPWVTGQPVYAYAAMKPRTFVNFGADGITLSADGSTLYFSTTGGRNLYAISTAALRDNGPNSEVQVQGQLRNLGQKGVTDGLESDSNGIVYYGQMEAGGLGSWDPKTYVYSTFVRDRRINWVDTLSVATDGYLYFTTNQLHLSPQSYPGTDRRVKPYVLFRARLPNGGTKIT